MTDYGGPGKAYGDERPNDPSEWSEVPVDELLRVPANDGCPSAFRLFIKRYDSSSPDWEDFLHDPLRQMLMKPGHLARLHDWPRFPGDDDPDDPRRNVPGGPLQQIREDPRWHVSTFITNHHRKLSRFHASVTMGSSDPPTPGSLHVMIFKDPHPDDKQDY